MPKQGVGEGWVPSSQANGEVSGPGSVKFPVVGACMWILHFMLFNFSNTLLLILLLLLFVAYFIAFSSKLSS